MTKSARVLRGAAVVAILGGSLAAGAANAAAPSSSGASGPSPPTGDCAGVDSSALGELPVAEAVGEVDQLTTLGAAIGATDLSASLAQDGPFTIFAPTNDAFAEIPQNVWDAIVADADLLSSILGYHVVVGQALSAEQLAAAGTAETLSGVLQVTVEVDTLVVNGGEARGTCAGIVAANGTIFVVDRVLQPPTSALSHGETSVPGSSVPGSSVPGSSISGVQHPRLTQQLRDQGRRTRLLRTPSDSRERIAGSSSPSRSRSTTRLSSPR